MPSVANDTPLVGTFTLPSGETYPGYLEVEKTRLSLLLWSDLEFEFPADTLATVIGVLNDGRKLSLVDCVAIGGSSRVATESTFTHFLHLRVHHVAKGEVHISRDQECILEVLFTVDDATTLFSAGTTLTLLSPSKVLARKLLDSHPRGSEFEIGSHPRALLHTGRDQVFSSQTRLGTITAHHRVASKMDYSAGGQLGNKVGLRLRFPKALDFPTSLSHVYEVSRFLELMAGRAQPPR